MNTYLVARWGNAQDGSNGPDTNFLVVAATIKDAGELADRLLRDCPWCMGESAENFCGLAIELGTSPVGRAAVLHGPWVAHVLLDAPELVTWHRHGRELAWGPCFEE